MRNENRVMTQAEELSDVAARVWNEVGGPADFLGVLTASGPRAVLPSHFDVTGLATASVAAATLAAADERGSMRIFTGLGEIKATGSGCPAPPIRSVRYWPAWAAGRRLRRRRRDRSTTPG